MKKRLIVLEKRVSGSTGGVVLARLLAIFCAMLATVVFLLCTGRDLGESLSVIGTLLGKSFFNESGLMRTLSRAIPLMIAGIGMALAFKMKLWNIGAEGQMSMGAFAAAGVAMAFPDMPGYALIPLMFLAAFVMGALWAAIAGLPRAYLGVNETILTLMLNYVAYEWLKYLITGPWKAPDASGFPIAPTIPPQAEFFTIPGTPVHFGLVIALLIVALYALLINRSAVGYQVRVIGESRSVAAYAGMPVARSILITLMISGGIAGIAGMSEVAGASHRLETAITGNAGNIAIIVAWLSRLSPVGVVLMALLMAGLSVGGKAVQVIGVPQSIATIIQGLVLFFVLGMDLITQYKIRWIGRKGER